ncbi:MAG TPA: tetratricopeptide repeat protein [Acidobacteriota bacterium]
MKRSPRHLLSRSALMLLALAAGLSGCGRRLEHPNLLLISVDTLRADRLSSYGYQGLQTDNLDRLASGGVRFEQAFSPVPVTLPAHVSMLSGLYPFQHGVQDNGRFQVPEGQVLLAERLKAAGYRTAAFVSSIVLDRVYGLDQGFDLYDISIDPALSLLGQPFERPANATVSAALDWLRRDSSGPFFLFVHLFDPHAPYRPPAPFSQRYQDRPYDGELAFVDAEIGNLLNYLEDQGLDDETLVVFTADHGESLGEHGEPTHGVFLYDSTVRVPLILRLPGTLPQGQVVQQPCSLVDLVPTVLAALELPSAPGLPGRDLMPGTAAPGGGAAATAAGDDEAAVLLESDFQRYNFLWSALAALRLQDWKYVRAPRPELYNLKRDPGELQNLIDRQPDRARQMAAQLDRLRSQLTPQGGAQAPQATLDTEQRRQLQSLGYLGLTTAAADQAGADSLPDPKDKITLFARVEQALRLAGAGQADSAIATFREVLAENPESEAVKSLLGFTYLTAGRFQEAVQLYSELLQAFPENGDYHYNLAYAFLRLERRDEGLRELDAALAVEPQHSGAISQKAAMLLRESRPAEAVALLEPLVERAPYDQAARFNLAQAYGQLKRFPEAAQQLESLLKANPRHPKAAFWLGIAYGQMGRRQDAARALQAYLRMNPNAPDAPEVQKLLAQLLSGK